MSSAAQIYVRALNKKVGQLVGCWPLGTPVQLGDYGTYTQGFFTRLGNIFDENLVAQDAREFVQGPPAHHEFKTEGKVSSKFESGVDVTLPGFSASSKLVIEFEGRESIYFLALMARVETLKFVRRIGNELIEKDQHGQWKRDYHVVTSRIVADKTRFLISGGDSAKVEFLLGVSNNVATPVLPTVFDVSLTWVRVSESQLAYEYRPENQPSAGVETPFIHLHKVHRGQNWFLMGPRYFQPASMMSSLESAPSNVSILADENQGFGEEWFEPTFEPVAFDAE